MRSVCVHGLGYVGLPTAAMLANFDHSVVGYDIDESVVEGLRSGRLPFDEPGLDAFVRRAFDRGTLEVSEEIGPASYHLICVPTPFEESSRSADLSHVRVAARSIASHLREGDTVVLESTVPPGTTRSIVAPELETSGLVIGEDVALAHCPETVLPGNLVTELRENHRVIGGLTRTCARSTARLYDSFVKGDIHTVRDATTAEFIKLAQNTYRDVNIALANELAKIARDYGVDSREAFAHANFHPRVELLNPGPGVGGHCLPIDPWFLGHSSDELDLVVAARRVNDDMVDYVIERLKEDLGTFDGRRIAVLGAAYKQNVDDTRRSPGLRLADHLLERAADPAEPVATAAGDGDIAATDGAAPGGQTDVTLEVPICDPRIDEAPGVDLVSLSEAVSGADAAVITVAHDEFRDLVPNEMGERMARRLIFDTRGMVDVPEWTDAGFTVRSL